MAKPNNDNLFGKFGSHLTFGKEETGHRGPFINRPTKGKTARKRKFKPTGVKTNIGDPCKSSGGGKRK